MTLPARWSREQFLFRAACRRVVALYIYPPFSALLCVCFLFSRLPSPGFPPLFPSFFFFFSRFPEDRFSDHSRRVKPKACCTHTRAGETGWWEPRRGLPGHFDRANCLNSRPLFAMLCALPRRHSPLLYSDSLSRSVPSLSSLSLSLSLCCAGRNSLRVL